MGEKEYRKKNKKKTGERVKERTKEKSGVKKNGKKKGSGLLLEGTLITNRKGFGFVEVEELDEDIFVSHGNMAGGFHKDTVLVELLDKRHGHRMEGAVRKVLAHEITTVCGTYSRSADFGFVVPDLQKIADDIYIAGGDDLKAADGDKVVCRIKNYGGEGKSPEGVITEILGRGGDPHADITSVIRQYELPEAFADEVKEEAQKVPDSVGKKDIKGRVDLRKVKMVTIDGEDSKDLDDAVSLEVKGKDYILGVHIADVSHYVKEGGILDKEALKRGTSVYLADRVIPMLPVELSNGICSLNEGVDRLAMSCIMRISKSGIIRDYEICESVINVDRRMTYTAVAGIIDKNDAALKKKYKDLVPMFESMKELAAALKKMRSRRGSIDFDLPESKIELDENGFVKDIHPYERNSATSMIEQFMLSANECVAAHSLTQELPFLYRVHETPDPDRMRDLMELLRSFGYHMKGDAEHITPKEIQKLLAGIAGRDEEDLIRTLALRSMKQARYDTECLGHFGLAVKEYTHFTSPIRRYPDLQIHRILKEEIRGKLSDKRIKHYEKILEKVAKQSSDRERRAVEAERDTDKLMMASFMADKKGEVYEGVISGVTGWGLYVQLPNTVEGLVHISRIEGDDFDYSEKEYSLIGRYSGKRYRLGEKVKVKVDVVDLLLRTIDFRLVWDNEKRRNKTRRK
ncbi:MAG: ribonuclease R [Lachnospiraceae bacterium]|nr:ribonuclease R [Lachnospiraceae bacterium]